MKKRMAQRADGRFTATFVYNKKRYYCYGATQKEAKAKAEQKKQELIKEFESGAYKPDKECTFGQFAKRWDDGRKGTVKEQSRYRQQSMLKTIATVTIDKNGKHFVDLKLTEVDATAARILQQKLNEKYTTNYVNQLLKLIKCILNEAVNQDILIKNPCRVVKPLQRTEKEATDDDGGIHRALTDDERKTFFSAASGNYFYNLFCLMINSGMRLSEACALSLQDITNDNIIIRRHLSNTHEGRFIDNGAKTDAGARTIPLTDSIRAIIERQKKDNLLLSNNVIDLNEPIFKSPNGKLIEASQVNREIRRICDACGVERFTSHAFRDSFTTAAIESGMNPKVLASILGHADVSITLNLYAHAREATKQKEMNNIKISI